MNNCENCLQNDTETLATVTHYFKNPFGEANSRNVSLCDECFTMWKEIEKNNAEMDANYT